MAHPFRLGDMTPLDETNGADLGLTPADLAEAKTNLIERGILLSVADLGVDSIRDEVRYMDHNV